MVSAFEDTSYEHKVLDIINFKLGFLAFHMPLCIPAHTKPWLHDDDDDDDDSVIYMAALYWPSSVTLHLVNGCCTHICEL